MNYTYHLFSGNWCPMCVMALPQIMSTFKELELDKNSINFYDVNVFKTEPKEDIAKFKIRRIPTLVVLDENNNEVGRITEFVNKSWSEDIKKIIG